jgi:hypothetical protein
VLELVNRLPLSGTLQWIPPAPPGASPKPAGRLKAADAHGGAAAVLHQRTHLGHRFQVLLADGRVVGPFDAGSNGRGAHGAGNPRVGTAGEDEGAALAAAWAAAVVTRVKPDREGLKRTTTTVDVAALLRLEQKA